MSADEALAALPERVARATRAAVRSLEPLPGGISSLTFSARLEDARQVVVKVAPPGLPPVRNRDVLRQARVLSAVHGLPGVRAPQVLATEAEPPPLFVMEHVDGESWEPRWDPAVRGPAPDRARERVLAAAAMLAHLHEADPAELELGPGEPALSALEELERWARLFATVGDELRGDERRLYERLARRAPAPMAARITHGDYRLGNLLFADSGPPAIIDWEIWSLTDPRCDLAWLAMFCDPAVQRRDDAGPAVAGAAEVIGAYERVAPGSGAELDWFTAYAHYKLASTMAALAKRNRRAADPDPTLERAAQTLPDAIERGLSLVA